jgi:hypothetical protein
MAVPLNISTDQKRGDRKKKRARKAERKQRAKERG